MARYLTPARIGLMAIIELYVEQAVPRNAILPVMSFLASHLLRGERASGPSWDRSRRWEKADRMVGLIVSISDFEKLLASYPAAGRNMPGSSLWDAFLVKLWRVNSLHALYEFVVNLEHIVRKTKDDLRRLREEGEAEPAEDAVLLTRGSFLGSFIIRAQFEFMRLPFNDRAELWKQFVRYRQPTAAYVRRRSPSFNRLCFDAVLHAGDQEDEWDAQGIASLASVTYGDMLTTDLTSTVPVSTEDLQSLIEFQIQQMQKFGVKVPLEVRHQIHDLLNDSLVVPNETHYVSYLEAWKLGDYNTAFEYLHRFFDFTVQRKNRTYYQYALMNLAVLQADFGCYTEAMPAIIETISTARENRDATCLNFALNWLFHFGRAHPELVEGIEATGTMGTKKETLAFLRVKTKELGMSTLRSSVLVSEAKTALHHGDSLATAFECMVRSSYLVVSKNMKNVFSQDAALFIGLWDRLGLAGLATRTGEVFLRCHVRNTVFHDELRIVCRLALRLLNEGHFEEAGKMLTALDHESLRAWKVAEYWQKCRAVVQLRRELHHNNLAGAETLLGQLLQSKFDDLEPDLEIIIDMLHVDALSRRKNFSAALSKVENMIQRQRDDHKEDVELRVSLLLAKVRLMDICGRPQRGFSLAMRAASLAWRARLMARLWEAIGSIANILIALAEFRAAVQLLLAVLPRSLECDTAALSAQLYAYLGDANMGLAGQFPKRSSRRTEHLTRALAAIDTAFDLYSSVEEIEKQCEMMAKKAMIMKLSGERELAADYAGAYARLRMEAKTLAQSSMQGSAR